MNVKKIYPCGTALAAALLALPAQAQVTIGGDPIEVNDGAPDAINTGGQIDTNGATIIDSTGPVVIDDALTANGLVTAQGGLVTRGANINTNSGNINLSTGSIANVTNIGTVTVTATGLVTAEGGLVTRGANINTGGGNINLSGGNIVNITNIGTGTLAVTSNATIGQDLAVGRNLTVAGNAAVTGNISTGSGDIVTVTGDVVAGGIRLDSSTGRVTGVAAGVANTDAVNVGQLNGTLNTLNARIDTVNARVDVLTGRVGGLEYQARQAFQGVAMGFAMNAAPLNLDNGEGGISAGAGVFEGEYAGAIRAQFVTESGFGVGANVGFSSDAVGGGVGASIKF